MQIDSLIEEMVLEIRKVRGVSAVVLGGSRARGTHTPGSDIDLGIYYHTDEPLDLPTLNQTASFFDDAHRKALLTALGGWGPWINGGGWLQVRQIPVDIIYRDLARVDSIIHSCRRGIVDIYYQPGHPFGFLSSIYMGEVAACKILWENPRGQLTGLKELTADYPDALQKALINKFAWEIEFSLSIARKSIERSDIVYAAGCCFRASACLLQTLFALNRQYWLNEKGAVQMVEGMPLRPADFKQRIETAFALLEANGAVIRSAIDVLAALSGETSILLRHHNFDI